MRLPGVRHALHARDAAGRDHGIGRGRLRGLLQLREAPGPVKDFTLACPLPVTDRKTVVLGHGSGGKLTAQLIRDLILPAFDNPLLNRLDDQAVLEAGGARIAFTTDGFVVTPLFFPGGDIGEAGGARDHQRSGHERRQPLALSAAFIIEEGLPMEELRAVVAAMAEAARGGGRRDRHR